MPAGPQARIFSAQWHRFGAASWHLAHPLVDPSGNALMARDAIHLLCLFPPPCSTVLTLLPESTFSPEPPALVAARTDMARRLALWASGLALGVFLVERLLGLPLDADSWLLLGLTGAGGVAWWWLKTRHYNGAAWFLVASLFALAVASTCLFGSVRTVDNALILVGQVAVGIFMGRRALFWTTAGAIVLLGALTWADASGLLLGQPQFEVGLRTWLSQAACLVGLALMMFLNRTQMRRAQDLHLREAQQRLKSQLDRDLGLERFARVFHSSPAPIFVQSARTGAIVDVNRAFEKTMGYARKDLLNLREASLWLHDERHAAFLRDRRAGRRTGWHTVSALCRDGRQIAVQICSERDEDVADSLAITAMRVLGPVSGAETRSDDGPASGGALPRGPRGV